jgi:long-chain acyl-CoA synthetase
MQAPQHLAAASAGVLPDDDPRAHLHDGLKDAREPIAAMTTPVTVGSRSLSIDHARGARTLPEIVRWAAALYEGSALRFWHEGRWRDLSYAEVGTAVSDIARGLIALGVRRGERVSILAGTRAEWTLADLGALCAGAMVAPIYHSNSPEECRYILEHAGSRVVFCEDAEQLAKVAQVREHCPQLDHVVAFDDCGSDAISLDELRGRGWAVDAGELDRIAAEVRPGDVATIVYTSGTTGPPKGCITTHANLVQTARMYEQQIDLGPGNVVFMFLPLAHLLARVTQMVVLDAGGTLAYSSGDPRRLLDDLRTLRPTHLPTVPRVLEKIHTAALSDAEDHVRLRGAVLRRALAGGRRIRTIQRQGRQPGWPTRLRHAAADRLVLSKVRGLFGTDLELVLTGAAPIATDVLEFFDACGVLVLEGYGLSETTAAATLNTPNQFRFGTVGRALPGVEVSIATDGEILIRGPNVFAGYYKDEPATREALSDDGWLRSGDLGSLDDDGFLRITGRKKDIIITSGGKSITPANIEGALRGIRWVSEALVFGNDRPYLVAALTLDRDWAPSLAAWLGVRPDISVMARDGRVHAHLAHEVDRVNERFGRVEQIKRFAILDRDLTQETGELTPTQKAKRAVVYSKFKDVIDSLYE